MSINSLIWYFHGKHQTTLVKLLVSIIFSQVIVIGLFWEIFWRISRASIFNVLWSKWIKSAIIALAHFPLTYFLTIFRFDSCWKHNKVKDFLMLWEGEENIGNKWVQVCRDIIICTMYVDLLLHLSVWTSSPSLGSIFH